MMNNTPRTFACPAARLDKFDLRREMATVVEQSLRETLTETPEAVPLAV
jgi:hypothetical protein